MFLIHYCLILLLQTTRIYGYVSPTLFFATTIRYFPNTTMAITITGDCVTPKLKTSIWSGDYGASSERVDVNYSVTGTPFASLISYDPNLECESQWVNFTDTSFPIANISNTTLNLEFTNPDDVSVCGFADVYHMYGTVHLLCDNDVVISSANTAPPESAPIPVLFSSTDTTYPNAIHQFLFAGICNTPKLRVSLYAGDYGLSNERVIVYTSSTESFGAYTNRGVMDPNTECVGTWYNTSSDFLISSSGISNYVYVQLCNGDSSVASGADCRFNGTYTMYAWVTLVCGVGSTARGFVSSVVSSSTCLIGGSTFDCNYGSNFKGDGICQSQNNNEGCDYDGGDCCPGSNCGDPSSPYYIGGGLDTATIVGAVCGAVVFIMLIGFCWCRSQNACCWSQQQRTQRAAQQLAVAVGVANTNSAVITATPVYANEGGIGMIPVTQQQQQQQPGNYMQQPYINNNYNPGAAPPNYSMQNNYNNNNNMGAAAAEGVGISGTAGNQNNQWS